MSWLSLPLFLIASFVFRYVYDLAVVLAVSAVLGLVTGRKKEVPSPTVPADALCPSHRVTALGLCGRCGRFVCSDCATPGGEASLLCVECSEANLTRAEAARPRGLGFFALLLVAFAIRSLAVGAAIGVGTYLRPERWFLVWLVAGIAVSQPQVSPPTNRHELWSIRLGRLVVATSVAVGALFPGSMPTFVQAISKMLVF